MGCNWVLDVSRNLALYSCQVYNVISFFRSFFPRVFSVSHARFFVLFFPSITIARSFVILRITITIHPQIAIDNIT